MESSDFAGYGMDNKDLSMAGWSGLSVLIEILKVLPVFCEGRDNHISICRLVDQNFGQVNSHFWSGQPKNDEG